MTDAGPVVPAATGAFLTVGIGASAGGLEAFKSFFAKMPEKTGMAFVLVQHLSPDHVSMLAPLLDKATRLDVIEAVDGVKVEPDLVYVIPRDATMTMVDGRNRLSQQVESDARATLGDLVFQTTVPRNVRVSEAPSLAR